MASKLLAQAQEFLERFPPEPDKAQELYERALELEPNNAQVLDEFGAFLCDVSGDVDRARQLLGKSRDMFPENGAEKYLYLAQISEGTEALQNTKKGIRLLEDTMSSSTGEERPKKRQKVATAYAAIAELYMTDLCDEVDAEEQCETALQKGLETEKTSFDVRTALITLRKTQGRLEDAKKVALELVKEVEAIEDPAMGEGPDSELRGSLCQSLIDLGLHEEAQRLLRKLLEEDDESLQTWYLIGCCCLAERDEDGIQECIERGLELCKKLSREEGKDEWCQNFKALEEQLQTNEGDELAEDDEEEEDENGVDEPDGN